MWYVSVNGGFFVNVTPRDELRPPREVGTDVERGLEDLLARNAAWAARPVRSSARAGG